MYKRIYLLFLIVLSLNTNLSAQNGLIKEEFAKEGKTLPHFQVASTAFIPYGLTLAGIGLRFAGPDYLTGYIMSGFSAASDIPACIVDPSYSIPFTLTGTGMMLSHSIWGENFREHTFGHKNLTSIGHFGMDMNMYTAYHGYAEARKKCVDDVYQNKTSYTFSQLLYAPFDKEVLKQKYVYTPILALSTVFVVSKSLGGFDQSIFKTGNGYFGRRKVNALAGLAGVFAYALVDYAVTGVGEESLFRGTGYEEMKVSWGIIPAKITDDICFAGAHVPQDIFYSQKSAGDVASAFISRATMGLILQGVYDECGLKGSTAVHMWIDTVISVLDYMYCCGVENDHTFSIKCKIKL